MVFNEYDVIMGLLGGLLIGLAASLFLIFNGRIAGISGIATNAMMSFSSKRGTESFVFLVGLIAAPLIYTLLVERPEIGILYDPVVLILGGLIVGIGTRIGGGCTSGHGVAGISRLSVRSILATLIFVGFGMVTASLIAPLVLGGIS